MKKQTSNRVKSLRDPVAEVGREPADHDLVRVLIPEEVDLHAVSPLAREACFSTSFRRSGLSLSVHPPSPYADVTECEEGNSCDTEHHNSEREPEIHQPQTGTNASE